MSYEPRIGMQVVCIKRGRWAGFIRFESAPLYGAVCTVRTIEHDVFSGHIFLRFDEFRNPDFETILGIVGEPQFRADRFRPLTKRATDISIFTAMLTGAKQRERA